MHKMRLVSLLLIIALPLFSGGRRDNNESVNLTLRGKLILTGNEPHTFLMLVCEDNRKYQLTGDLLSEMKQAAPGQTVLVYGFLSEENPGKPLTNSFKLPLFKVNSWDADKINKNLLPERKPGS